MSKRQRAFAAVDRFLGGDRPPTRVQLFAARHPVLIGFCFGAALLGYGMASGPGDAGRVALTAVCAAAVGWSMWFACRAERRRHERLAAGRRR
ncbi:hypothetical protein ACWDSD_00710 [Streptomyces spiralis]